MTLTVATPRSLTALPRRSLFPRFTVGPASDRRSHLGFYLLITALLLAPANMLHAQSTTASPAGSQPTAWQVYVSAFAAGDRGAIHQLRLDGRTGELSSAETSLAIEHPFFFAISPDKRYLYSIEAPGSFGGEQDEFLTAWKLDPSGGPAVRLNRQSTRGTAACYVDIDATGKQALVANYLTGSVASLPILADGSLGPLASFVQHEGSSVRPDRQSGPHAHCFTISPDNRFAYAADLGIDQVRAYQLDPTTATITPATQPFVRTPPAAGPRHLTFAPSGNHVYVINELSNSITHYRFQPESGFLIESKTVSTLPEDFTGTSHCADLKITPDGRFLYGTNRGHDSLAAYAIDAQGELTLIEIRPSLGQGPQNLAITPDGRWLLCGNMPGDRLVVFAIDSTTGKLTPAGEPLVTPSPSCIRILAAP